MSPRCEPTSTSYSTRAERKNSMHIKMSIAGQLDLEARTFDIYSQAELNSIVTLAGKVITLSYVNENGILVQFRKTLPKDPMIIEIGSTLISSDVLDADGRGGFAESTTSRGNSIARSLAFADFSVPSSLDNFEHKTILDPSGTTHTAILLPVEF